MVAAAVDWRVVVEASVPLEAVEESDLTPAGEANSKAAGEDPRD